MQIPMARALEQGQLSGVPVSAPLQHQDVVVLKLPLAGFASGKGMQWKVLNLDSLKAWGRLQHPVEAL